MTHKMVHLVFQIAVIIITTRLMGLFFRKVLKQPASLGEIITGMIIGPYLLGGITIPFFDVALFPPPVAGETIPVTPELYGFATVASIVLLFLSGLETDLPTFLRFAGKGSLVGIGGIIFSFGFGYLSTILWFGLDWLSPTAFFMGTLSTATSVGITARILTEKGKMGSPEGVTILAGAVLDDVIGIILLAVVVGISGGASSLSVSAIAILAAKAFGFWIICTVLGIILIPYLTKGLKRLKSISTVVGISFGLALLLAGFSEMVGLAMIIGAYIMGLSFSQTDIAPKIRETLEAFSEFLVPIFFCVMGMMVDFSAMKGALIFGMFYTVLAILGKVVGCGLPAMLGGFNLQGGLRIGLGMLPRGEVALIIAGIGLSSGAISQQFFGVSVIMLLITTLMAPPLLVSSFKGGSGYKKGFQNNEESGATASIELDLGNSELATIFRRNIVQSFRNEEFFVRKLESDVPTYAIRKDSLTITIEQNISVVVLVFPPHQEAFVRLLVVEEVLQFKELLSGLDAMERPEHIGAQVMMDMFLNNKS